ncbi:hypothetical protein NDU88_003790 [Pleurodeles waltl]|uniref:Uncharacterized protein n=1 Tax=Pleurodeles waltl TaxID=8319 RepID=A0AAV7UEN6_PLEWA|nr:hypothetical protein NDU88_003790 [Pleurodeles waltl]
MSLRGRGWLFRLSGPSGTVPSPVSSSTAVFHCFYCSVSRCPAPFRCCALLLLVPQQRAILLAFALLNPDVWVDVLRRHFWVCGGAPGALFYVSRGVLLEQGCADPVTLLEIMIKKRQAMIKCAMKQGLQALEGAL